MRNPVASESDFPVEYTRKYCISVGIACPTSWAVRARRGQRRQTKRFCQDVKEPLNVLALCCTTTSVLWTALLKKSFLAAVGISDRGSQHSVSSLAWPARQV